MICQCVDLKMCCNGKTAKRRTSISVHDTLQTKTHSEESKRGLFKHEKNFDSASDPDLQNTMGTGNGLNIIEKRNANTKKNFFNKLSNTAKW